MRKRELRLRWYGRVGEMVGITGEAERGIRKRRR